MLDSAFAQPLQNGALRCLALVPQRIVHVTTFFSFRAQSCCAAQIGLVSEHNEEFGLLSTRGMLNHPWRNLAGWARNMQAKASRMLALPTSTPGADRP
jgi:hypothetical protein